MDQSLKQFLRTCISHVFFLRYPNSQWSINCIFLNNGLVHAIHLSIAIGHMYETIKTHQIKQLTIFGFPSTIFSFDTLGKIASNSQCCQAFRMDCRIAPRRVVKGPQRPLLKEKHKCFLSHQQYLGKSTE